MITITWYMTDCLYRVGSCVDDCHHCRDDAEKDASSNSGDGGDVELVDEELPLVVEDACVPQHVLCVRPVPQPKVEMGLVIEKSKMNRPVGLLRIFGPLTISTDPMFCTQRCGQQGYRQAAAEKSHENERPLLEIHVLIGWLYFW